MLRGLTALLVALLAVGAVAGVASPAPAPTAGETNATETTDGKAPTAGETNATETTDEETLTAGGTNATTVVADETPTTGAASGPTEATVVTAATATATRTADAVIEQRVTLSLTPATPGRIRVQYGYEFPSYLGEFRVRLSNRTTLQSATGFDRSNGQYVWDGTSDPTITVTYAANRTARETGSEASAADGDHGFLFTDRGPWALVQVPGYEAAWRYERGREPPELVQRVRTDGPGVAGTKVAFLGAHTVHERVAHGQRLRLVVPGAATLRPSPTAVLNATATASDALRVGDRDESVWLFAAPTSVDWAVRGLQTGPTDAWVQADTPVTTPDNVWIHEYVHTRQSFTPASETAWLTEGSADYYAAALSLRAGTVEFDAVADTLRRGRAPRVGDTVLTRPETWGQYGAYHVGALVAGELDRRLRADGDSLDTVLAAANAADDTFTPADLEATLSAAGDDDLVAAATRYTTTTERPTVWNRSVHAATFGGVAAFETATTTRVAGPYREGPLSSPVVTGETVVVDTRVQNTGDTAGDYRLVVSVDGVRTGTRTGRLRPGESTTVTVNRTFETAGDHTVVVGDERVTVSVRTPASPRVDELTVPSQVAVGDEIPVRVGVSNPMSYPAVGNVTVAVDGRATATRRVTLPPNGTATLSVAVAAPDGGDPTITAGNRTATVTVTTPTPTSSPTATRGTPRATRTPQRTPTAETTVPAGTATSSPSAGTTRSAAPVLGVAGTLLAVALAVVAVWRRRA
ncbi:CARDB domain-containing protein [Halobaculum sp. MBLA0143]|uniref:CARDB domain-containing protein n=1 Tax=Halobaculum sp. MBLA0143 TaxID=3079933 RepID=UPI0035253D62